jgi:hypothetical protein
MNEPTGTVLQTIPPELEKGSIWPVSFSFPANIENEKKKTVLF